MGNILNILKELKRHLVATFGEDIAAVILLGSQASGKATEDSDFDILVLVAGDYSW